MNLIGLTGAVGAGRKPVVQRLEIEHGFVSMSIADRARRMIEVGLDVDREFLVGPGMAKVVPHLGVTGQALLSTLAGRWGRRTINDAVWVTMLVRDLGRLDAGARVVVPDVRTEAEAAAIRELGGSIWLVQSDLVPTDPGAPRPDVIIPNHNRLSQLHAQVDDAIHVRRPADARRSA